MNDPEKFYKRVQERHFWFRFGSILLIIGFSLIGLLVITIFVDTPFITVKFLTHISIFGILLGSFCTLLFGRLGWSRSKFLDLLFNRLSIILIIVSIVSSVIHAGIGYSLEPIDYNQVVLIVGVILALFGIRFQSTPS